MKAGLLGRPDFRRFWLADVLSQFGTRISVLAIPLLATQTLHASAFQVSMVRTLGTAAYLLLALHVGAWCDRIRVRPVLVIADLGRAAALATVPLAAAFGSLTITHLLVAVGITGVLTVWFDVAHQTYLPRLIGRDDLVEGNARLQANMSIAAVAAPSPTGFAVQAVGGASVVGLNALGYLWSALWLRSVKAPEHVPPAPENRHLRREIAEGLRFVVRHPVLRAVAGHGATHDFFQSAQIAIVVVFLSREVRLSPFAIGLLSTSTLAGAVVGAFAARPLAARFGHGRALLGIGIFEGVIYQLFPFTGPGWALACYVVAGFGSSFGIVAITVLSASFQQAAAGEHLRGRVNATVRFLVFGVAPLGSLLGGVLAETAGLRATLFVAAGGVLFAMGWLVFSPLRTVHDLKMHGYARD